MKILDEKQIVFNQLNQKIEFFKQALRQLAGSKKRLDEVEQQVMRLVLQIGKAAVEDFVQAAGDGDVGEQLEQTTAEGGTRSLARFQRVSRTYRSVFGVIKINRYVYGTRKKQKTFAPLDKQLGLPEAETSYLLEQWMGSLACYLPYENASKWLKETFGLGCGSTTIQRRVDQLAAYSESFRQQDNEELSKSDEEVLVAQADAKGLPIRTPWAQTELQELGKKPHLRHHKNNYPRSQRRRLRGDQAKSQQATVGACYSIARNIRTAVQAVGLQPRPESPRPKNKKLFGELNRIDREQNPKQVSRGAERVFIQIADEVAQRRQPDQNVVCVIDGAAGLRKLREKYLPDATAIIDIYHVSERLWSVAHCLERDGSQAAEDRVTHWLRMLFNGKVDYVRGLFSRLLNQKTWSPSKQQKIKEAINYFKVNRNEMQYDQYLARGFPIGSGVIEGACKHLIGDRFCGSGMRWEHLTAQSLLHLRAIELSERWDQFIQYRIESQQKQLYQTLAA